MFIFADRIFFPPLPLDIWECLEPPTKLGAGQSASASPAHLAKTRQKEEGKEEGSRELELAPPFFTHAHNTLSSSLFSLPLVYGGF